MFRKKRGVRSLASALGVKPRTLSGGTKIRANVLSIEKSSWTYTIRKTRSDAISDKDKEMADNFWLNPENSRPSCNKNDTKRFEWDQHCIRNICHMYMKQFKPRIREIVP